MKNKILSLVIVILMIIAIPLNVFANKEYKDYSFADIENFLAEETSDLSKVGISDLYSWLETIEEYKKSKNKELGGGKVALDIVKELREPIEDEIRDRERIENLDYWKPSFNGENTKFNSIIGKLVGALQTIGSIISVAALAILGIKYMISSVEEKAKYKETMIAYVIGCLLVFGISNVTSIIYNLVINMG